MTPTDQIRETLDELGKHLSFDPRVHPDVLPSIERAVALLPPGSVILSAEEVETVRGGLSSMCDRRPMLNSTGTAPTEHAPYCRRCKALAVLGKPT